MEFLRQEYWRGLPFPPPGDLPNRGIKLASLVSPALVADSLPTALPGKPPYIQSARVLSRFCRVRLCVTDPMDCSLLSSSVHRILQIRILKWVAIPFCRGSSRLRDQTCILCIADRFVTIRATREPLRPSRVTPSELATLSFCYKKKIIVFENVDRSS